MEKYSLNAEGTAVVRKPDGVIIHFCEQNPDYIAYRQWLEDGNTPDPASVDPEAGLQLLKESVSRHLDSTVAGRMYKSMESAVSWADDPDPVFAAEGAACKAWRSAVWAHCRLMRDEVLAGARLLPSSDELIAGLPPMVWPDTP
jgi:hypothetical protein